MFKDNKETIWPVAHPNVLTTPKKGLNRCLTWTTDELEKGKKIFS